jgi:CRP/FNR family cyclic AMP-dependent transcriptional regulator
MAVSPDILRAVPLFSGMTDRAIAAVADLGEEADYPAEAVLVREGDPGDAFVILLDGRAAVTRGDRQLTVLAAGDYLGEISLVDGRPRSATVTALEPIHAIVIRRPAFERLMDSFPQVRLDVLMSLTERIRRDGGSAVA